MNFRPLYVNGKVSGTKSARDAAMRRQVFWGRTDKVSVFWENTAKKRQ